MTMKTTCNNSKIAVWLAVAAVLVLAAGPVRAEEKYEERFSRTEALTKAGKVELSNISGDIEVAVWKESQVKIEALKTSRARTLEKAKENAAEVTIEVTRSEGLVKIETKYPKRSGGFWGGDSINVSVDYKLWVPDQASIAVKSVSGDVRSQALGGRARIGCVSGDVELLGAASGAEVDLVSGDLVVRDVSGDVFLKTVSGEIEASGIKGSLKAETVSGDIRLLEVVGARTVDVKSVSGDITYTGDLPPGARHEIRTHSGSVRMTLPASASFEIDAGTFSGDIEVEFEVKMTGKFSRKEFHGTVGTGGATVLLKSFSGDIDLKKR